MVAGFGVGGGLWVMLANLAFIRHYDPKHFGEINGFNAALTLFASVIGPLLFSVAYDASGTFAAGPMMCIVCLLVTVFVKQPLDSAPERRPCALSDQWSFADLTPLTNTVDRNIGNK